MEIRARLTSPWHDIPLADYEGHMGSPQVAQAPLLAATFADLLKKHVPRSVAILGCSGGNGFERIRTAEVTRVVGVDINSGYIERLRGCVHSPGAAGSRRSNRERKAQSARRFKSRYVAAPAPL